MRLVADFCRQKEESYIQCTARHGTATRPIFQLLCIWQKSIVPGKSRNIKYWVLLRAKHDHNKRRRE